MLDEFSAFLLGHQMMILLTAEVAQLVENSAAESLEKFGVSWRRLSTKELLDRRSNALKSIQDYEGIPLDNILKDDFVVFEKAGNMPDIALPDTRSADEFFTILITLAIIQTLLTAPMGPSTLPAPPHLRVI